jgi:alkanesulfonate monooxygenase SsuD/methylene tetrahydromethanopterin reductase-like flavin-dependent oxidoreductase (luciferase family)
MKFGIFDHMDRGSVPLGAQYESRLKLVEAYDAGGFHAYHLAEHHATPLGMAPSPSVFLAAVAQRTRRLRLGPLVYTLPLYHPVRVYEEICMLDHMSGGRLELGVGRGAVPHEIEHYSIAPSEGQARYFETYEILMKAFAGKALNHAGTFYSFRDVPLEIAPVQKPHPPLWYGVSQPEATAWAAQNNLNVVINGPTAMVRGIVERYRSEWAQGGRDAAQIPFMAMNRHIVIAETDRDAQDIAERAYAIWRASFLSLWQRHGTTPPNISALYGHTFAELQARGQGFAGSPDTVRSALERQIRETGVNYLMCRFAFGDLSFDESHRTVGLFVTHVMSALSGLRQAAE